MIEKKNFNKIQPELNFEVTEKTSVIDLNATTNLDLNSKSDSDQEVVIPTSEELEKLKETDYSEYISWMEYISNSEINKHQEELSKIAEEEKQKELESLYTDETKQERYRAHLYGND